MVATATFIEEAAALSAAQTLHNVDNRTETEKRKANHSAPKDWEKFCVQVVGGGPLPPPTGGETTATGDGVSGNQQPSNNGSTGVFPVVLGKKIRIRQLPQEWSAHDIKVLCGQYGGVASVLADGPGRFVVAFSDEVTAKTASEALAGLQVPNKIGCSTLACEVIPAERAHNNQAGADEAYDPERPAEDAADEGMPLLVYADELLQANGEPGLDDREIYLQDLPLEDYTEQQLLEWLDSFGHSDRVVFLKNPETKELTGQGYVRFRGHAEAAGLIAAFPVDDDEGNVQGSWSLSERLVRSFSLRPRAAICEQISQKLKTLGAELGCSTLVLAGDGRDRIAALAAVGLGAGPLHFAAWPRARLQSRADDLQGRLKQLLEEVNTGIAEYAKQDVAQPALPRGPCVVVRGLPDSWTEHQVRLVFALFGGVSDVRFIRGQGNKRAAYVSLKNPENIVKAIEQLHGTQVGDGDLIEECVVQCERFNGEGSGSIVSKGPVKRAIFIDDLSMVKRPDIPAGDHDREVFLSCLPVHDCSEEQIKGWLEGFGIVEDVQLLRDSRTGEFNGKGYVRFKTHREANACVEAQASVGEAEEGDVVASWSESERAGQRAGSVYGLDVHTAFAGPSGRVLASILVNSKMKELWMFSELHQPKDQGIPKPEGKQLHFITICDDQQYEELRGVLGSVLSAFHDKVAKRLKEANETRHRDRDAAREKPRAKETRSAGNAAQSPQREQQQQQQGPPPWQGPEGGRPPHQPWQGPPPYGWYDWHGQFPPPDRVGGPGGGPGFRPPFPPGPYPPDWRGPPPGAPPAGPPPPGWAGMPPDWRGPAPPPNVQQPRSTERSRSGGRGGSGGRRRRRASSGDSYRGRRKRRLSHAQLPERDEEGPSTAEADRRDADGDQQPVQEREAVSDSKLQNQIVRGEQLVRDGKTAHEQGQTEKAYEKYCRGLQYLLDVMPKLGEDKPKAQALRLRINGYLDEAEKLKQQLDAAEEGGSSGAADAASRVKAAVGDALVQHRVDRGEALIREGQQLEDESSFEEAYEKYCRGLQYLLEVMPKLAEDSPRVADLRAKISGYLEQAETLKERLESQDADSVGQAVPGGEASCNHEEVGENVRHVVFPPPPLPPRLSPEGGRDPATGQGSRSRHRQRRGSHHGSCGGAHGARHPRSAEGGLVAKHRDRTRSRSRRRHKGRDSGGMVLRPGPKGLGHDRPHKLSLLPGPAKSDRAPATRPKAVTSAGPPGSSRSGGMRRRAGGRHGR